MRVGGLLTACSGQARQGTAALVEAAGAGSRLDPPTAPPQHGPQVPWQSVAQRAGPGEGFVCQDQGAEPCLPGGFWREGLPACLERFSLLPK